MAAMTRGRSHATILHGMPYKVYARMTRVWANRHLRMCYHDGTLEIVSPHSLHHEEPAVRFRWIVTTIAEHLGLDYHCSASSTFHHGGDGVRRGVGKEPDESFYFANARRLPRDRDVDLNAGDPPPDLWIEVENRVSSVKRFPIYARLQVPEVWRYRSRQKSLQFFALVGQEYTPIERSLSLPGLSPGMTLEAMTLGDNPLDSAYRRLLREWVDRTFPRPPDLP